VHSMKDNAHTLPGSNKSGDANQKPDDRQHAPRTAGTAECDEDSSDETTDDATDTKTTSKYDARTIAVADGPANEVGVGLATEGPLDRGNDFAEGRGVGGVLKSMEESVAFLGREVQLAGATVGNVYGYDSGDLLTIWLDG